MSNELCKCGKVGEISCPNDERCGTHDAQLPAEVAQSLKASVKRRSLSQDYADGYKEGYIAGATKLLTAEEKIKVLNYDNQKLNGQCEGLQQAVEEERQQRVHLEKENDILTANCKELERQNAKLKEQANGWRPLLEDILSKEDLGYGDMSTRLKKRIKKFLYGE